MSTSSLTAELTGAVPSARLDVEFFEPPLEPELWEAYERATRSYACTRAFLEYFEESADATLALVRSRPASEDEAAFMYRLTADRSAVVLGRLAAPTAEALRAFADAVFGRHPRVRRIDTNLIDALPDPRAIGRPVLALREATEMRVRLPSSMEEYERTLSEKFVSQTRYHERRLARDHPSMRFTTLERADIPRSWIADVVRLNRERMASKNTRSVFTDHYENGIFRVARAHGAVTILHDGSNLCGGVIYIHCISEAFGWVVGHDNAYGMYRPGRLCQLAGVRHCIASGVRTVHFLHGESPYKRDLGGRSVALASYVVLRNWWSLRLSEVGRVCWKHALRLGRRSVDAADRVARRVFDAEAAPVRSLVTSIAQRARRLGRR
jgi:CelD/BcsL family acetyltransferase involved in cellulose biosynthesis